MYTIFLKCSSGYGYKYAVQPKIFRLFMIYLFEIYHGILLDTLSATLRHVWDSRQEHEARDCCASVSIWERVQIQAERTENPGTPDVIHAKYRTAIFVNACFWHGLEGCRCYTHLHFAYDHGDTVDENTRRKAE